MNKNSSGICFFTANNHFLLKLQNERDQKRMIFFVLIWTPNGNGRGEIWTASILLKRSFSNIKIWHYFLDNNVEICILETKQERCFVNSRTSRPIGILSERIRERMHAEIPWQKSTPTSTIFRGVDRISFKSFVQC